MVNRIWPTAVAGEADSVSFVSASACHIVGPNSVNPGQILLVYGMSKWIEMIKSLKYNKGLVTNSRGGHSVRRGSGRSCGSSSGRGTASTKRESRSESTSNYFYNWRRQNYPPTLCPDFTPKRCDTDQNFFCKFCCPDKNRGPHVFSFLICAFVFELWSQT